MQKPLISVDALRERLAAGDTRVIDCRFNLMAPAAGHEAWLVSRVPGACYADLDKDLAGPVTAETGRHPLADPALFMRWLGSIGVTPGTPVVVYDSAGGAIAARLWWLLRWLGHREVAVLDGGWDAWSRTEPVERSAPAVPKPASTDYPAVPGAMPVLTVTEVAAAIEAGLCLLDARDAARFAGEVEPIDPVKGHVPGALNLPFNRLLGEDGCFLPAQDVKAAFAAAAGARRSMACMCGSGVTACHLILGAEYAGLPTPALYVGSWSEWIRDRARAVATSGA
jgi:thiosulfate/3-mercaptopyruvate sulfurtransferase